MRYGLFSDVHANLPALRAALGRLGREGVDAYVCAGDVVGYGPHPNECVEVLAELPAYCVAGNHDLIAVGRLSADGIGELARATVEWTRTALRADSRAWLDSLAGTVALGEIVVTHGSLDDVRRYVAEAGPARDELSRLAAGWPDARGLVLGHTHRAMAVGERSGVLGSRLPGAVELTAGERWLVNPGAVGQSRDRAVHARVAVLDLGAGRLEFHDVPYDVEATRRALREAGLPESGVQLRPRRRPVRSAVRRLSLPLRAASRRVASRPRRSS
jgi:predicted phosphodiesterase